MFSIPPLPTHPFLSLSLSLSHTHTHTHTHSLSLFFSLSLSFTDSDSHFLVNTFSSYFLSWCQVLLPVCLLKILFWRIMAVFIIWPDQPYHSYSSISPIFHHQFSWQGVSLSFFSIPPPPPTPRHFLFHLNNLHVISLPKYFVFFSILSPHSLTHSLCFFTLLRCLSVCSSLSLFFCLTVSLCFSLSLLLSVSLFLSVSFSLFLSISLCLSLSLFEFFTLLRSLSLSLPLSLSLSLSLVLSF